MRRWRKVIHRVVVYGLIGLAVNVLVAWGFAAWGTVSDRRTTARVQVTPSGGPVDFDAGLSWSMPDSALTGQPLYRVVGRGAGVRGVVESEMARPDRARLQVRIAEFGWPVPSLRWHEIVQLKSLMETVGQGWYVELPASVAGPEMPLIRGSTSVPRRLPLEPMWRGIVLNTAMFGGAMWLVAAAGGAARVLVRRRRGRCPRCGYDLRGDMKGGCPECGWGKKMSATEEKM